MKLHQIALAVAALAVGTAHADLPNGSAAETTVNNANTNGRVLFISGASAVKKGFSSIINTLFTSGSTYWFAEGPKSDYLAVAGKLAAASGTWNAGDDVIVIYRTGGGSVYGVNPVARAEAITSLNVSDASCGATGAGTVADPYVCATDTRVPDAGVSDVAPFLFKSPVNTEGETAAPELTPGELGSLTSSAIYGLSFGVPVTSNVPSTTKMTRSLLAAIMSGNVGTWNEVDGTTGDIVICRRTPGSGTQAVMNLWAGNYPCSDQANIPADRDSTGLTWDNASNTFTHTANTGGLVVIENFASGDVATCLDKAVTGGTYTTKDRDGVDVTVNFGTGGHKAVGVLSMDSLAKSKSTGNWQFRSLDGAGKIVQDTAGAAPTTTGDGKFPTLAAYEYGDWDLQGWVSFNVPSRTTGNKLALANTFLNKAQDPAILASIPDLKYVAAGIPGGTYTGSQVLDAAYLNGNQCGPYNRNKND